MKVLTVETDTQICLEPAGLWLIPWYLQVLCCHELQTERHSVIAIFLFSVPELFLFFTPSLLMKPPFTVFNPLPFQISSIKTFFASPSAWKVNDCAL